MQYRPVGRHVTLDIRGVKPELLDDADFLLDVLRTAAAEAGVTVLQESHHKFEPQGVTAFLLLSESHLSIHTYPEHGVAFIDAFTCGQADPLPAVDYIRLALGGDGIIIRDLCRGFEEE